MADPRDTLIAAATHFYQRGWMLGTAGNLSLRAESGGFWITASGRHKGALQRDDFVRVGLDAALLETPNPARKPSAETSIHRIIYQQCPDAAAVYHVHSVEANLVSHWHEAGMLALPPLEMIKAFGVWEATARVSIPVFDNLAVLDAKHIEPGGRIFFAGVAGFVGYRLFVRPRTVAVFHIKLV